MDYRFLIPAMLFLLSLVIRSVYELRKDAGNVHPGSKAIVAVVFTAMCVLWVSWFSLCPTDPFRLSFPDPVRWTGFAFFIIGSSLAVGALIQLRGVENIDHLVTTGLFGKFRHPMYVGFIFWILGWSIYHSAIVSLAIGSIGIANVLWWRHLEETRLEAQFGREYQQYRLTTWF